MFEQRLERILREAQETGKFDILHKDGRHFYADHVKKVRSPKGGRIVLMLGIGKGNVPVRIDRDGLVKHWTYRVKDFYQFGHNKAGKNALTMAWRHGRQQLVYDDYQYNLNGVQLFKHVLKLDLRNVISINGEPVQRPEQPPVAPTGPVQA